MEKFRGNAVEAPLLVSQNSKCKYVVTLWNNSVVKLENKQNY